MNVFPLSRMDSRPVSPLPPPPPSDNEGLHDIPLQQAASASAAAMPLSATDLAAENKQRFIMIAIPGFFLVFFFLSAIVNLILCLIKVAQPDYMVPYAIVYDPAALAAGIAASMSATGPPPPYVLEGKAFPFPPSQGYVNISVATLVTLAVYLVSSIGQLILSTLETHLFKRRWLVIQSALLIAGFALLLMSQSCAISETIVNSTNTKRQFALLTLPNTVGAELIDVALCLVVASAHVFRYIDRHGLDGEQPVAIMALPPALAKFWTFYLRSQIALDVVKGIGILALIVSTSVYSASHEKVILRYGGALASALVAFIFAFLALEGMLASVIAAYKKLPYRANKSPAHHA